MGTTDSQDPEELKTRGFQVQELTADSGTPRLPRVLEPQNANDIESLIRFIKQNKGEIEDRLRTTGGVLLRGWEVTTTAEFEAVLATLEYKLEPQYLMGTTPRSNLGSNVFSSTEAPAHYPIFAHNEMSYLNTRPMVIAFYCQEQPLRFGETPIFDTRAALRKLDPCVRERLAERKVRYVRALPFKRSFWQSVIYRTWPETFLTTDRAEVERIARSNSVEFTWKGDDLITEVVVDPIVTHPETGELSLNVQLYHEANMLLDVKNLARRQGWVKNYVTLLKVKTSFKAGIFPIEVRYANGDRIPSEDIRAIRQATWDSAVLFAWKRNDVLLLENLITAHGRMNVEPPRRIVAAFGRMISFQSPHVPPPDSE